MPVALTAQQTLFLQLHFANFARKARAKGIADQDMCEWLASLGVRWLHAHGVSKENVHAWVEQEMRDARSPQPIVAGARAKNDFGGHRR